MRSPFQRIRDFFRKPAMSGTPPSKRSSWHDPAEHYRDFAERYAEPMNYHVENRMMELGISYRPDGRTEIRLPDTVRPGRRRSATGWRQRSPAGGAPFERSGRVRRRADGRTRPEAGAVWGKSGACPRSGTAVIAHEGAESLAGGRNLRGGDGPKHDAPDHGWGAAYSSSDQGETPGAVT